MSLLFIGHIRSNIFFSDVFSDLVKVTAGLTVSILLLRLHVYYSRPRAMMIVLVGMILYTVGALLNFFNDVYELPWLLRYVVLNVFDAAGVIVSAVGIALMLQKLFELINVDPLTGCYNRRFLQEMLNTEMEQAKRSNGTFSLLFVDIDNFKAINDKMGHAAGDAVLKGIALKVRKGVRLSDMVARWGGDEFVVVFPQTDRATARALVQRLVGLVNGQEDNRSEFTVSVGMATYPDDGDSPDRLVSLADKRMYQNKNSGGLELERSDLGIGCNL